MLADGDRGVELVVRDELRQSGRLGRLDPGVIDRALRPLGAVVPGHRKLALALPLAAALLPRPSPLRMATGPAEQAFLFADLASAPRRAPASLLTRIDERAGWVLALFAELDARGVQNAG